MTVTAVTSTSITAAVGAVWDLSVSVTDADGVAVATAPTVTVTRPDGTTTTPTVEVVTAGFRALYTFAGVGRHTALVTSTYGAVAFMAYAAAVTTAGDMPDLDAAKTYLGIDLLDTSRDTEVQDALDAEAAAQRAACRIPAEYGADLRAALLRRVARHLAMQMLPLAVLRGDGDAGDTILPGRDPEVRRFEGPYRRRVMG